MYRIVTAPKSSLVFIHNSAASKNNEQLVQTLLKKLQCSCKHWPWYRHNCWSRFSSSFSPHLYPPLHQQQQWSPPLHNNNWQPPLFLDSEKEPTPLPCLQIISSLPPDWYLPYCLQIIIPVCRVYCHCHGSSSRCRPLRFSIHMELILLALSSKLWPIILLGHVLPPPPANSHRGPKHYRKLKLSKNP